MIYESLCLKCGTRYEYIRKSEDYLDTPECCGEKTEKRLFSSPMMKMDIQPWDAYESPATGKMITSYKQRREDMKASGCRDYEGFESESRQANRVRKYQEEESDKKLDKVVNEAWAQLPKEKKDILLNSV